MILFRINKPYGHCVVCKPVYNQDYGTRRKEQRTHHFFHDYIPFHGRSCAGISLSVIVVSLNLPHVGKIPEQDLGLYLILCHIWVLPPTCVNGMIPVIAKHQVTALRHFKVLVL